jgi:exopolysaccharide biosynthesis polyprenyl glycosylphosphotransferase
MIQLSRSLLDTHPAKSSQLNTSRLRMTVLMFLADLTGLVLAIVIGHLLTADSFNFHLFAPSEVEHILMLGIILLVFRSGQLYPGVGINPAEEIRLVTQYSSSALIIGMILTFILRPAWLSSAVTMLSISALSIANILLIRWSVRIIAAQAGIWGEPVVVLARRGSAEELTQYFLLIGVDSLLKGSLKRLPADVHTILIEDSFFGQNFAPSSHLQLLELFQHIIFISDMNWLDGASLSIRDFEGLIGIEARREMLNTLGSSIKRIVDIVGSLLGIVLLSPCLLAFAILIKLDSEGPAFYTQPRLGRDGKRIKIYKFRTMVTDAEQALADYLKGNEQAQREWEATQKLRNDPRVTRVGKILRRFSIDEIPQLFNVLLGDMSLVGPRPIMLNQIRIYGEAIDIYQGVRPGMTGLWQVSGRNRTTFQERALFDVYYVRHWSMWLDIYVLFRTVWIVLVQDGAY